jgi:hypothetical protein
MHFLQLTCATVPGMGYVNIIEFSTFTPHDVTLPVVGLLPVILTQCIVFVIRVFPKLRDKPFDIKISCK